MRFVPTRPGRFARAALAVALFAQAAPASRILEAQSGSPLLFLLGNHNAVPFTPTPLGTTSAPQTVTLTNGGSADLVVSGMAIGGVNAADFVLVSSTCGAVAPGAFCTATISFTPQGNGEREARLLVTNNADGSMHTIPILGRGVDPDLPQRAVGPIDPRHGFPVTYTDLSGTTVELCLYHAPSPTGGGGTLCLSPTPDPTRPASLTDTAVNFPDEAFWWSGEASIDAGNVDARLVLAQEAAFLNELPAVGDQVAFGRLRIRLRGNNVVPGAWYRFTHPFGVDEIQVEAGGDDISATGDVGCFSKPCDFTATFTSRISHFLRCVSPAPPAGYLGDPNTECTVTGSPTGTNLFRVARISGPRGTVVETLGQTNQFAISGKLSAIGAPPPPPPPVNTAPTAGTDSATTAFNTPVTIAVLANDADADNDPLIVTAITSAAANGIAAIASSGAAVVYTPNPTFSGSDAFAYAISDGRGGFASAVVTVAVAARPNAAPVAVSDSAATTVGVPVPIAVLANDSDPDGDTLAIVSAAAGTSGSVTIVNGTSLTYTPDAGFSGTDSFSYSVSDGRGLLATATVTVTVTVNATTPAPAGLVLALGFNEAAGTAAIDASPSRTNGTLSGATRVAGRAGAGGALSFDGDNDWVTVADAASLDMTTALTLEAWVNPRVLGGWRSVLMKERVGGLAYSLYADNGVDGAHPAGTMFFGALPDRSVRGTSPLAVGAWTHLAVTYDGTTMRLYVNGAQAATLPQTGSLTATARPFRIGGNGVWSDEFFDGLIDDVRVYNRALSAAEIEADMNTPIQ